LEGKLKYNKHFCTSPHSLPSGYIKYNWTPLFVCEPIPKIFDKIIVYATPLTA